jgi:DNA-binding transcriptional MerR regulator
VSQIAGSVPFATVVGPLRATVVTVTLAADSGTQMDAVLHGDETRLKCGLGRRPPKYKNQPSLRELARMHRLLALRDLGFTLDQISRILNDEPPLEQLRGTLRMRQAQIEQTVGEEQARLRRIDAHLRPLERNDAMDVQDIVIKHTQPLRVAEAVGTAPGFGHENLGPVFGHLLPEVRSSAGSKTAAITWLVAAASCITNGTRRTRPATSPNCNSRSRSESHWPDVAEPSS